LSCFADDTGLEVEALSWEPGVYSARYAGESKNPKDNIRKLLDKLKDIQNRKARFRTVIALILNGQEYLFDGVVWGKIIDQERGSSGFGYDPIFVPDGFRKLLPRCRYRSKTKLAIEVELLRSLVNSLKQSVAISELMT